MTVEVKDQAKEIIGQLKTIISTICDDQIEIIPQINPRILSVEINCSARDTALLIGRNGRTKMAIAQLVETKAKKLNFVPRIDLWVQEKKEQQEKGNEVVMVRA